MTETLDHPASATGPDQPGAAEESTSTGPFGRRRTRSSAVSPAGAMVNLLSPWVVEENRVYQLRQRFFLGAVVVVVLWILTWTALHFEIVRSQEELRGDQAIASSLRGQIADLGPVRSYTASVDARGRLVGTTMSSALVFSETLRSLDALRPEGVVLESITATSTPPGDALTPDVTASCPGPDPFDAKIVAGCVILSGTAPSREVVSAFVLAMVRDNRFVQPFVETTTTDDEEMVTFSGTVGLGEGLLSSRYADLVPETTPSPGTVGDPAAPETPTEATP